MDNNIIGILMKHGEDDYSLWQPEIPADDPMLVALLEKYRDSGCSVRGNGEEVRNEILPLLGDNAQDVHVIMYYDPVCEYTGLDVFTSFDSALAQFDGRLADEEAEHEDDPAWIELSTRNVEDHELHFRASNNYEVFYRREKLQQNAFAPQRCVFCGHSYDPDAPEQHAHCCDSCGKIFCSGCYRAMTGCAVYQTRPHAGDLCPHCALKASIRTCVQEWLPGIAELMPPSFYDRIFGAVADNSGFNSSTGYSIADIRKAFAKEIASMYNLEI